MVRCLSSQLKPSGLSIVSYEKDLGLRPRTLFTANNGELLGLYHIRNTVCMSTRICTRFAPTLLCNIVGCECESWFRSMMLHNWNCRFFKNSWLRNFCSGVGIFMLVLSVACTKPVIQLEIIFIWSNIALHCTHLYIIHWANVCDKVTGGFSIFSEIRRLAHCIWVRRVISSPDCLLIGEAECHDYESYRIQFYQGVYLQYLG